MKIIKALDDGRTDDIIYSMAIAAPAAIKQAKKANLPEVIGLTGSNVYDDAIKTGKWIRANVTYKIDDFGVQNIQLPSAILKSKLADCKSISLLYLSIMEAAGYNGGFRFVSYKENRPYSHVYNYFLDNKGNIYTFDACLKDLKEINKFKSKKDMRINYIAGVPMVIKDNNQKSMKAYKPTLNELMTDDRYLSIGYVETYVNDIQGIGRKKKFFGKLRDKIKDKIPPFVKKGFNKIKTVGLAPARGPFLVLVNINFRGIASKFEQALQKNPEKVKNFWLKIGGDFSALQRAIDKGKSKKPFLGSKGVNGALEDEYISATGDDVFRNDDGINAEPVSTATAITLATGILTAAAALFKSLGIKAKSKDDNLDDVTDPNAPIVPEAEPGEPVIPNDPASAESEQYIEKGIQKIGADKTPGASFTPSPMLIIGGVAALGAIYLLTKKKK